jgi:hypothetical protein
MSCGHLNGVIRKPGAVQPVEGSRVASRQVAPPEIPHSA